MAWIPIVITAVSAAYQAYSSNQQRKDAKRAARKAEQRELEMEQKIMQEEMDAKRNTQMQIMERSRRRGYANTLLSGQSKGRTLLSS